MMNNKPEWKDAPEWAMWLAQDGYGAWGWYENKPASLGDDYACWDIVNYDDLWQRPENTSWDEPFVENDDWDKTLEPRPEN